MMQLEDLPFIEISSGGRSLRILGAQDADAGDYECIAMNEAGSDSTIIHLDVGCTSTPTSHSCRQTVELLFN